MVFAGTASRPPLGRAEVTLTIDNSDGALPIEYAEVTISRLLFRSGQSEYSINGDHCRLLDVQELLSDSGLGREMHVIVGQGQLDQVLHAGPEARRALIEEAAGVLKHRRRKEKALRKLEAMQVNLTRLVDLTAELRRRLKPLGRQAALARRAAVIQADLRDARLRLLADDYVTAATALERDETDEAAALARRAALEQELAGARQREATLDADEQQHAPRLAAAQEAWFGLSALAERIRSVASLAQERHTHLATEPDQPRPGRDPDELEQEAEGLREQEAMLGERLETAREQSMAVAAQRAATEAALAAAERRLADQARAAAAEARAAAAHAERLAKLRGRVEAAAALRPRPGGSRPPGRGLRRGAFPGGPGPGGLRGAAGDLGRGEDEVRSGLTAELERSRAALAAAAERVSGLRAAEREASAQRAALRARTDALGEGLHALRSGKDASGALLADPGTFSVVLGTVAALVTVQDGAQEAIAAALGSVADAVAVAGLEAAVAILEALKSQDAGSAGLIIASDAARPDRGPRIRAGRVRGPGRCGGDGPGHTMAAPAGPAFPAARGSRAAQCSPAARYSRTARCSRAPRHSRRARTSRSTWSVHRVSSPPPGQPAGGGHRHPRSRPGQGTAEQVPAGAHRHPARGRARRALGIRRLDPAAQRAHLARGG